jgi:hypothetical protein
MPRHNETEQRRKFALKRRESGGLGDLSRMALNLL